MQTNSYDPNYGNEDTDGDGNLDVGEDLNGNGQLDPLMPPIPAGNEQCQAGSKLCLMPNDPEFVRIINNRNKKSDGTTDVSQFQGWIEQEAMRVMMLIWP